MNVVRRYVLLLPCLFVCLGAWSDALPSVKPEKVGFSQERLDRITESMQVHIDNGEIAGMIGLLARDGKIGYFKAQGLRDIEADLPMTTDTIIRIYSMSKPITSVAIMMLYEEGHFMLRDPVSKYIPALGGLNVMEVTTDPDTGERTITERPSKRDMTIQDLLRHTAGLTYGFYASDPLDARYQEAEILSEDRTLAEMIDVLKELPLNADPGTRWHYSVSVDVLGRLVEVFSGQPLDVFMKERIFEPLGMEDTAFNVTPDKVHRYAAMYSTNEDKELVALPQTPEVQPKFLMGGGGLYSTTLDYLAFCQMMLNKGEFNGQRLLSRKTVELMTRNHLGDIPTMGHGLSEVPSTRPGHGFGLGYAVITGGAQAGGLISDGSYYWGGAAHTRFWIDPAEDFIGIFMVHIFNPQQDYQGQFRVLGYQAISD